MEPTTTSITTLFNGFDLSAITHDVSSSAFSYPYTITLNPLNKKKNLIEVKSIKYSGKYTTVTWNDGTKTRVSCGENEQQSRYSAFCSALAIKVFGTNSQVKKLVETKDEQIEIDKQNRLRAEQERIAKIRKARKDRLWVKKRAKELVLEQRANEMAKNLLGE